MMFLSLEEYLIGARKIMTAQRHSYLIKDEDAVAHVAYRMMLADQTWNGLSSKNTWRYNQAKYAIMRVVRQKKKEHKHKIKSLDYGWQDGDNYITLGEIVADYHSPTNELASQCENIYDCADRVLSGRRLECFNMYYKDGLKQAEIGNVFGITRQAVSQYITSGIREVRKCLL